MVNSGASESPYPIRSVDRVCDILDTLADSPAGASLSTIADTTGLPKSSTFRYLSALEARGYVERTADAAAYQLGFAFRVQHSRGLAMLIERAEPALQTLRDETGETTNLGTLDGAQVIHELVCESPHMMRLAARVGSRWPIHSTALGKAMAATLPDQRVTSLLAAAGMAPATDATITTIPRFLAELQKVRECGYAIDEDENQKGGRCIAVSIPNLGYPAAISISALASRLPLSDVESAAAALQYVARDLSAQVTRRDPEPALPPIESVPSAAGPVGA